MVLCMKLLVKKIQDDWVRSQKDKILPIVLLQNFPSRFFFEHYYRIPSNQSRQLLHQGRICLEKKYRWRGKVPGVLAVWGNGVRIGLNMGSCFRSYCNKLIVWPIIDYFNNGKKHPIVYLYGHLSISTCSVGRLSSVAHHWHLHPAHLYHVLDHISHKNIFCR